MFEYLVVLKFEIHFSFKIFTHAHMVNEVWMLNFTTTTTATTRKKNGTKAKSINERKSLVAT